MTLHSSADTLPAAAGDLVVPDNFPDLAFAPAPTRKRKTGWTAEKQRRFIETLAVTASVAEAAEAANVDPCSAYRLRDRPGGEGFARAWQAALGCAATRLEAILLERAINGRVERVYNAEGTVVHERRVPSDDLLKWLLVRLDPMTYGSPFVRAAAVASGHDPRSAAREALPAAIEGLADIPSGDCPLPRVVAWTHRENEPLNEGDCKGHGREDDAVSRHAR